MDRSIQTELALAFWLKFPSANMGEGPMGSRLQKTHLMDNGNSKLFGGPWRNHHQMFEMLTVYRELLNSMKTENFAETHFLTLQGERWPREAK